MEITKIKAKTKPSCELGKLIKPPVKCFCCMDSGLVSENIDLSRYTDGESEIRFICNRSYCENGKLYQKAYYLGDGDRKAQGSLLSQEQYQTNFDDRLLGSWCEQIHRDGLYQWQESIKKNLSKLDVSEVGQWR